MKTERDVFDDWHFLQWKLHNAVTDTVDFAKVLYDRVYSHDHTSSVREVEFKAWCASAQREGYKLVPLEMHWHKADDLASAEWDKHKALFCSDNRDMTALQVEEFRLRWCKNKAHQIMNDYKAMIGAAP